MNTTIRTAATALLAGVAWAAVGTISGLTDPPADEPIKDRASFLPQRKYEPLKGTVIGMLVYDPQPILSTEGRSGPKDELCFSVNGNSYRWVYVPVSDRPQITNLRVPVGEKENVQFKNYPALDMARPPNVVRWGVVTQYALVEVEVNDGLGSPKNDSFVATKMRVLDGSKQYPLHTGEAIKTLKGRYAAYLKAEAKAIEAGMSKAQKKAIGDGKATGPREPSELMYVTWMADSKRLRVHFRTRITDGQHQYVEGGPRFRPNPLPLPPGKGGKVKVPPPPPPPPLKRQFKIGTSFGVELGMAYEVDREGKLVRLQQLPLETFEHRLPPPPAIGPRGRPVPLPATPPPAKN